MSIAIIQHRESQGTYGGAANGTSGIITPLDTVLTDTGSVVTLHADGSFDLAAGNYLITARTPCAYTDGHRLRIVEVSGSTSGGTIGTTLIEGLSTYNYQDTTSNEVGTLAVAEGYLSLPETTRVGAALFATNNVGSLGLGIPSGIGEEIYTQVTILSV